MAKHIVDYAYKSKVLKEHSDLVRWASQASRLNYCLGNAEVDGDFTLVVKLVKKGFPLVTDLQRYVSENNLEKEFKECHRINSANYKRVKRLRNRVSDMLLSGTCIFLTLTFTDETLAKTTEKERRIAVTRFLKLHNAKYIANIDFGALNGREHYHALIQCECVDYSKWNYGAINGEKIRNKDISSDSTKLSKYISKLSNHAIKETTKRCSLIYSR